MKTSYDELYAYALCEAHDIVILQETWLAKNELSLLFNTHCDFIGNGVSSIDDELKINSGRPHGGIGIMWRKNMNKHCTFKTYNCNRIVGLEINCGPFKALFLCVYMPCDSSENYDDFMFYLSKLLQIADEFPSPHIFICGDFNANIQQPSRFGKELIDVCNANSLCFSDKMLLPNDTYTSISSSHSTTSWLNHILSTSSGHSLLQDVHVKGDYISSDHLPLCFNVIVNNAIDCVYYSSSDDNNNIMSSFNWNGATDHDLYRYSLSTKSQLSKLSIPLDALRCSDVSCTVHQKDIDNFYYSIVNTVNGCIRQCIPLHRHCKHSIVGWNDEVKHYYIIARTELKYWKQNGMPRSGHIFRKMSSARARFKYPLRQCRLDEQCISSENLASFMQCHDLNNFWKNISLPNKSNSTLSNCINGTTGEGDIANLWKNHYRILLNSSEDDSSKDFVYDSFKNISFNQGMHVTVNEVLSLVHSLESGKSAGLDGLNGECLKYADVILSVLLSFCFTCMFKHSYLPSAMLDSVIIPLVKNKCGDLSDISNYRPIAISCIVSKIFEKFFY